MLDYGPTLYKCYTDSFCFPGSRFIVVYNAVNAIEKYNDKFKLFVYFKKAIHERSLCLSRIAAFSLCGEYITNVSILLVI